MKLNATDSNRNFGEQKRLLLLLSTETWPNLLALTLPHSPSFYCITFTTSRKEWLRLRNNYLADTAVEVFRKFRNNFIVRTEKKNFLKVKTAEWTIDRCFSAAELRPQTLPEYQTCAWVTELSWCNVWNTWLKPMSHKHQSFKLYHL